jgi:hypothetical protein
MASKNPSRADNQQGSFELIGWIVGFVDGEGCFSISIFKNRTTKLGWQVLPEFVVTQGERSLSALQEIKRFFGCGEIYLNRRYDNHNYNLYRYCVRSFNDLSDRIIPFFKKYPLKTYKQNDFKQFCQVIEMIKDRKHLTSEGLKQIAEFKGKQLV